MYITLETGEGSRLKKKTSSSGVYNNYLMRSCLTKSEKQKKTTLWPNGSHLIPLQQVVHIFSTVLCSLNISSLTIVWICCFKNQDVQLQWQVNANKDIRAKANKSHFCSRVITASNTSQKVKHLSFNTLHQWLPTTDKLALWAHTVFPMILPLFPQSAQETSSSSSPSLLHWAVPWQKPQNALGSVFFFFRDWKYGTRLYSSSWTSLSYRTILYVQWCCLYLTE